MPIFSQGGGVLIRFIGQYQISENGRIGRNRRGWRFFLQLGPKFGVFSLGMVRGPEGEKVAFWLR